MRSFFKKPAWAVAGDDSNAPEFYRRSKDTYNDIIAANRQQHREAAAASSHDNTDNPSKRRRITEPNDESTDSPKLRRPSVCDPAEESKANGGTDLDFENGSCRPIDSEKDHRLATAGSLKNPVELHESDSSSSPYLQESKGPSDVKDRFLTGEEAASRPEETQSITKVQSHNQTRNDNTCTRNPFRPNATTNSSYYTESRVPDEKDDIVQILITSAIKDTKPLVVQRRMSQRFRDVRLAWCERQGFDEKMTSSVYLTWNKRRLFDVTTCRSLDLDGMLSAVPINVQQLEDETYKIDTLRIHVEAVTDELLKSQAELTNRPPKAAETATTAKETTFSVVLRSQDTEELLVKVRSRTKVSQIIKDFRNRANIAQGTSIQLSFDGDILDPESRLEKYDVADLDLIEVLLK